MQLEVSQRVFCFIDVETNVLGHYSRPRMNGKSQTRIQELWI